MMLKEMQTVLLKSHGVTVLYGVKRDADSAVFVRAANTAVKDP